MIRLESSKSTDGQPPLTTKAVRSGAWLYGRNLVTSLINLGVMAVLARQRALSVRLTPPELHPDLARLRRSRPGLAKATALFGALFPYLEYVAAKYSLEPGSKKVYWYYLVRLKDLARRYGWQFWRVVRSEEGIAALAARENALGEWWMGG
jgi:hypothetical protein